MIIKENKIILENIPINAHTSKYRFKRKVDNFVDYIVLQDDKKICENDYIEWQISYDAKIDNIYKELKGGKDLSRVIGEGKNKKLISDIVSLYEKIDKSSTTRKQKSDFIGKFEELLNKYQEPIIDKSRNGKKVRVILNELSDFLKVALNSNIITVDELNDLKKYATSLNNNLDIEYHIEREVCKDGRKFEGFNLYWEKYPLFISEVNKDFFVEIIKKHMQYAIGYQNMIFLCAKAKYVKKADNASIIGDRPEEIENIKLVLDRDVLIKTAKAFIIASENHKNDLLDIINALLLD